MKYFALALALYVVAYFSPLETGQGLTVFIAMSTGASLFLHRGLKRRMSMERVEDKTRA